MVSSTGCVTTTDIESLGYRTTIGESKIRFEPHHDATGQLCSVFNATRSVTPDDLALFVGRYRSLAANVVSRYRTETSRAGSARKCGTERYSHKEST